jgi:hypothetical protein
MLVTFPCDVYADMLPAKERYQIIKRIVNYLDVLKTELSVSCVKNDLRY